MIQLPKVLDSNGNEVGRLHPIRVRLNENIVPLSTASIEVIPEEMVEGRTYVEMFTVNGSAGIYRTRAPQIGYGSARNTINLEHGVCEIGDWLVRAEIEQTEMTLAAAVQRIFAYYGGDKWQLGTIAASGRVVLSCRYSNLLQTINSLLTQVPGAMLTFDFSTKPWTLGIGTRETTVSAEGRLSRNVVSAVVTKDDSQLFTRVWLTGLPGGYIDADTISEYGIIETKLNGSDYTASQAQIVANAYIARHKRPKYSVRISGEDFSGITGETLDRAKIGKLYRLVVEGSTAVEENIVSISWGDVYGSPYDVTITLAETEDTVIQFIQQQANDTYGAGGVYDNTQFSFEKQTGALEAEKERAQGAEYELSHSIEETDESLTTLYQKTGVSELGQQETLYSRISQNADSITAEVGRATEAEGTLSGRIRVTAEAVTAEVTRATESEGRLSGRIDVTAENITAEVTRATAAEGTLSGRIRVTAEAVTAEVTRATAAEETLSGRISVNADNITAEVTRASAAEGTLSGRISVNADNITAEVTRSTAAEGELSGRITVTAENITAEVTRATTAEGELSGRISVNADNITAEVTRANDAEGTLSGRINVTAGNVTTLVQKTGINSLGEEETLYSKIESTVDTIELWVGNNYYGKQSGITINSSGITVTGNKYISLQSGGYIDVNSSNFKVDSNGVLTASKFVSVDENGKATEINLSNYPLWRLSRAVKTLTNNSGAISIELYNGTSINFNSAASVRLSGSWSGRTFTVTASNTGGKTYSETLQYATGTSPGINDTIAVNTFSTGYKAHARVLTSSAQGSNVLYGFNIDASSVAASITAAAPERQSGNTFSTNKKTVYFNVRSKTSDGKTGEWTQVSADVSESYNAGESAGETAGYNSAKVTHSWSGATVTFSKSTSGSNSASLTLSASALISYDSTTHKYTASASAIAERSTRATDSATSGTEAYSAGVTDGYSSGQSSMGISAGSWSGNQRTISAAVSSTKSTTMQLSLRYNGVSGGANDYASITILDGGNATGSAIAVRVWDNYIAGWSDGHYQGWINGYNAAVAALKVDTDKIIVPKTTSVGGESATEEWAVTLGWSNSWDQPAAYNIRAKPSVTVYVNSAACKSATQYYSHKFNSDGTIS